ASLADPNVLTSFPSTEDMKTIGEIGAKLKGNPGKTLALQKPRPAADAMGEERVMRRSLILMGLIMLFPVCGCAATHGNAASKHSEVGMASYYSSRHQGRSTASGEPYDEHALTAAHRTLPFGTRVRVTNLANDHSVVVTINDRGPYRHGRIIDVSKRAARELGFMAAGKARVRVERLD